MSSISNLFGSTMLIERLCGVSVYAGLLYLFYKRIKTTTSSRSVKKMLNHYMVILCILAFFYIPGSNADLFRWRAITETWSSIPFRSFFVNRVLTADTPAAYLLMYFCQRTGIKGLLPMACALIFYWNSFHIFKILSERYNVKPEALAIGLVFFMSPGMFLEVISGVRCFVAFSIICRCICDEYLLDKSLWKSIVPYIIACLFHTASLVLIVIRLTAFLFEKKQRLALRVLNIIAIFVMGIIAIRFGNNFVDATLEKASNYTNNPTYYYYWEYIIGGIGYIIIMYNIYPGLKRNLQEGITRNIATLLLILSMFELIFIQSYSIFHRYVAASTIIFIPLLVFLIDDDLNYGRKVKMHNVLSLSIIILLLACARGNLCGYKFFIIN